jgi:hypothetical protein
MKKMMKIVGALLAIAVGAAGFLRLVPRNTEYGLFESSGPIILRYTLAFAAAIAGVIIGSFYRRLREMQARGQKTVGKPSKFVVDTFRSTDMWLGFAGSPILFALLLQSTAGISLPGLLIIALENGFCCLVIINQFVGAQENAEAGGGRPSAAGG